MGDKLTLDTITSLQNETSVANSWNENAADIETAIDNTLSRDGTSPNEMNANLDMNNYKIINLPYATTNTEPVTLGQFSSFEGFADSVTLAAAISDVNTAKTAAEAAQTAAEAAQTAAETAYDSFDDRYLGAKSSDPASDNDGDALIDGALYYNTTSNTMFVYDLGTTTWISFASYYSVADNSITLAKMEHGTQGDILYYGASGTPTRLSAGTSGQFLQTSGAGANPVWATVSADAGDLISSWTHSGDVSEVDFTGLSAYTQLVLIGYDITTSTSSSVLVQVSTDNGSTFKSASTDYKTGYLSLGGDSFGTASAVGDNQYKTTGGKFIRFSITGFNSASIKTIFDGTFATSGDTDKLFGIRDVAEANDALRVLPTSGNFTGGSLFLFGLKGT